MTASTIPDDGIASLSYLLGGPDAEAWYPLCWGKGGDFRWVMGAALENVELKAQGLYSFQVYFRPTEVPGWCGPLFLCYLRNTPLLISSFLSCISFSVTCLRIILSVVPPEMTKCTLTLLQSPLR